jgi:hypothetical protein
LLQIATLRCAVLHRPEVVPMTTTSPARIDDDLYASAKLAGEVQSRSASQQVAHWARIGREIEASGTISHKDIAEVLAGSRSYDSLSAKEQALVRAEWSTRMDVAREALNLAQQFEAAGRTWVELDDDGAVVTRSEATGDGVKAVATRGKRTAAIKPPKKQTTASGRRAGGRSVG